MPQEIVSLATNGPGLYEFSDRAKAFVWDAEFETGLLTLFVRHTSCSLLIQENADPDVRRDLLDAFERLAPQDVAYHHQEEGLDDMPSHIKAMLTDVSLSIPVQGGRMALGTWQGVYLIEHRARPHRREIVLQFAGSVD